MFFPTSTSTSTRQASVPSRVVPGVVPAQLQQPSRVVPGVVPTQLQQPMLSFPGQQNVPGGVPVYQPQQSMPQFVLPQQSVGGETANSSAASNKVGNFYRPAPGNNVIRGLPPPGPVGVPAPQQLPQQFFPSSGSAGTFNMSGAGLVRRNGNAYTQNNFSQGHQGSSRSNYSVTEHQVSQQEELQHLHSASQGDPQEHQEQASQSRNSRSSSSRSGPHFAQPAARNSTTTGGAMTNVNSRSVLTNKTTGPVSRNSTSLNTTNLSVGQQSAAMNQVEQLQRQVAELQSENEEQAREIDRLHKMLAERDAGAGVVVRTPGEQNASRYSATSGGSRNSANRGGGQHHLHTRQLYASTRPAVPYTPWDLRDPVDNRLAEFYNSTGSAVPFHRINKGFYRYGETVVELDIINHKLMAKTEDGWNRGKWGAIEKFMSAYEPMERERMGLDALDEEIDDVF
ncbi:unnamed protein product [Amoebophrya sp. A120]|nr:unnamed protein product [Amoebophrya sp. A120]|eukprot:GSA120T00021389001.1